MKLFLAVFLCCIAGIGAAYRSLLNIQFEHIVGGSALVMLFWIVYDIGKHNEHERLKARALELMRRKQEDDSHFIES